MDDPDFDKIISSLNKKNILNKEDILEIKNLHCMPKRLNLENRRTLTNAGLLQLLGKCSATLEDLNLDMTHISGEGLESIPLLEQLEKVNFGNCENLKNAGLLQLLAKCSATLKDLRLNGTKISGEGLESIPVLKQLEEITLRFCKNLTNTGLLQVLTKCSATLKDLDMCATEISGEGLEGLPVMEQLEKLDLGDCKDLTTTGLLQLLAKCSATLEDLYLHRTQINGEILADWIARHAPGKLRKLNLGDCRNVSAADGERIRTALPQCQVYLSHF